MEELLNEPRYRYAAILGSALFAAVFLNCIFVQMWDESAFVALLCLICSAKAGAMHGWFLMLLIDLARGRISTTDQ